jgi:hypothetical protein
LRLLNRPLKVTPPLGSDEVSSTNTNGSSKRDNSRVAVEPAPVRQPRRRGIRAAGHSTEPPCCLDSANLDWGRFGAVTGRIEVTAPTIELGRVLAPRTGSSANVVPDGDRSGCLVVLTVKTDRELGISRSVVETWLGDERLCRRSGRGWIYGMESAWGQSHTARTTGRARARRPVGRAVTAVRQSADEAVRARQVLCADRRRDL